MKTARVHHAARRRGGGVAARGAGAAAEKMPTIGFLGASTPSDSTANGSPLSCSDCANSAGSRVARSRSSIAGRRDATSASPRSRPSSSGSRSMSLSRAGPAVPSRQSRRHRSSRSCLRRPGPGRHRPGRELGAAGRQRHRPVDPADRSCRQAARTLARGCPRSPPFGDHGQCRQSRSRAGDGRGSGGGPHARP